MVTPRALATSWTVLTTGSSRGASKAWTTLSTVERRLCSPHGRARRPLLGELPPIHRRRAEVADLARLDDVVQCFHRLLDRAVRIEAVDLVEVDVVGVETFQRRVDLLQDRFPRQPLSARTVVHLAEHLGGQHDVLPPRVALDRPADDLLRGPRLIDVGGVPEGDAELDRLSEERLRLLVDERPLVRARCGRVAVAHAAPREPAGGGPGCPPRPT